MKRLLSSAAVAAGLLVAGHPALANDTKEASTVPMAKKIPRAETIHGDKLVDDYYWLRDRKNPEVKAYLDTENAYADSVMKPTGELQKKLYDEMLGRIKETDLSVPFRKGGWLYYSRTEKGKQYPIYCRRKPEVEAPEEIYLDVNELAKGEKFMSVSDLEVSDDATLLAYTTDNVGFREYKLHVKDLSGAGRQFPETVEKVSSVAWAADNKTLFYSVDDHAKRPYRIYRHVLGTDPKSDSLVYEEKDEMFRVSIHRSRSGKVLFLVSGSHTADEWRFIPADKPAAEFAMIAPREKEHEYAVDHRGDLFYIRTNKGCRNFRVVTAPVASPGQESWKEFLPCRPAVMVSGINLFSGHAAIVEREDGLPRIRIIDLSTKADHRVDFPEPVYAAFPQNNEEFDTKLFRFSYQSFTTPPSVYDYDIATKERKLLKRTEVLGGYDPERYQSERRYATASDGTKIPISLVYRKGFVADGKAPLWLNGYGSYGSPSFATFNSNRFTLLDRGFVFAIAHIRGGGEMGKPWHDAGKMMSKKNTFTDFIAVAEQLIADKYTSKDRLVIEGGSAGGLLMGAVTNMRPDLFRIVVSRVPFVDVINTMLDESLPLTVGEFEEWGNPKKKEEYDYIRTYSPYDNLAAKAYPTMLVKTSFDDSQVMYWEPAKYVAKLRTLKTDKNPLVFKINMAGGHGGSSGRYDRLKELAFDYAFVFTQLGISP
ncbi:MAG TPA: S9 family peptidase [Thermoanaerobaculia bacterium]|nr:S9 family peptidase [Thermoanaerobaculia bacterium]